MFDRQHKANNVYQPQKTPGRPRHATLRSDLTKAEKASMFDRLTGAVERAKQKETSRPGRMSALAGKVLDLTGERPSKAPSLIARAPNQEMINAAERKTQELSGQLKTFRHAEKAATIFERFSNKVGVTGMVFSIAAVAAGFGVTLNDFLAMTGAHSEGYDLPVPVKLASYAVTGAAVSALISSDVGQRAMEQLKRNTALTKALDRLQDGADPFSERALGRMTEAERGQASYIVRNLMDAYSNDPEMLQAETRLFVREIPVLDVKEYLDRKETEVKELVKTQGPQPPSGPNYQGNPSPGV